MCSNAHGLPSPPPNHDVPSGTLDPSCPRSHHHRRHRPLITVLSFTETPTTVPRTTIPNHHTPTTVPQVRTYLLVGMSVALISLLAASLCGAQGGPLCHALCMGLGLGFGLVQAGAWPCALRVQVGERHCVYIRYIGCLDVC